MIFGNGRTFKSFDKPQQLSIKTKVSQNQLRKQQQKQKTGLIDEQDDTISDAKFQSMMDENETDQYKLDQYKKTNTITKINQIPKYDVPQSQYNPTSNTNQQNPIINKYIKEIINKKIIGDDLVKYIELNSNNLNGIELLDGLLFTNSHENITWFSVDNYGLGLKKLFESKIYEQVIGLLMIQKYCMDYKFCKIMYKNNQIYLMKILFQLFFTFDIFDEEAYWKWQDYINENEDIDKDLKQTISIQTTEFFIILKTVFIDEDYEDSDEEDV